MPPAKSRLVQDDSRSETSTVRERQVAAAAHARKSKSAAATTSTTTTTAASAQRNGGGSKELTLSNTQPGDVAAPAQGIGMQWDTMPRKFLNNYRIAHNLSTPAAFTSPLNQALLTNPGIGRQSPTMALRKDKRRVSKEQLAMAVRKNFNGAAVNEIDVVVELAYKVRNQDRAFRMRSAAGIGKKS